MGSVILGAQSDSGHLLVHKPSILPSADMIGVIDPARKDELVERAASAFEPCQNAAAARLEEFKIGRAARPRLLNDDRTWTHAAAAGKVKDLDLDKVTSTQFAINRKIEHGAVA